MSRKKQPQMQQERTRQNQESHEQKEVAMVKGGVKRKEADSQKM